MLLKSLLIIAFLAVAAAKTSEGVTFKNVTVLGDNIYQNETLNITIISSNSLNDNLPNTWIYTLYIRNSQIPVLYKVSISDIEDVFKLILENDGITEIQPGTFKNLPLLYELVIRNNNNLEEIKSGVFNHLNVSTLDLSNNSINKIASGAFDDMPELREVTLDYNRLKFWDQNWFANTPSLWTVSFQNNSIEEIPASAFVNFRGKRVGINLNNNRIKKINKDAFKGVDKLNILDLAGNEIDTWDETLLSGVELRILRLDKNKLICLTGNIKNIFAAGTTHVNGNPWDCECLNNIYFWTSRYGKDVRMFFSKAECHSKKLKKILEKLVN